MAVTFFSGRGRSTACGQRGAGREQSGGLGQATVFEGDGLLYVHDELRGPGLMGVDELRACGVALTDTGVALPTGAGAVPVGKEGGTARCALMLVPLWMPADPRAAELVGG